MLSCCSVGIYHCYFTVDINFLASVPAILSHKSLIHYIPARPDIQQEMHVYYYMKFHPCLPTCSNNHVIATLMR